jgi:hypothetical protein
MKRSLLIAAVAFVAVGCATTETRETLVPDPDGSYAGIDINVGSELGGMPSDAQQRFEAELTDALHDSGAFEQGGDLDLTWNVIRRDPGNRFVRWLVGGMGDGTSAYLVVEADFSDRDGTHLGTIEVEGEINGGAFGGGVDDAVEPVARDVATYTIDTFALD